MAAAFDILRTEHWVLSHRRNSCLPGYLILSSAEGARDLAEMSHSAAAGLGPLLARTDDAIRRLLQPLRVYVGRYGHIPDQPLHFHLIPVYPWVEALFCADRRYRALEAFGDPALAGTTDGAELTFFIWREFCERPDPPPVEGPSVAAVVAMLAAALGDAATGPAR